ncbi:MAG: anaerobic ribonucleoside-triphosphate reductase activating protein [Lachnospiraceae bacterium]|nr:anaerobic ribonucleoside-triphosphate reductase activating protein [Lachnospiraceae bacterium]
MNICGLMKTTLLDFPGQVACTVFTGGCNFRCPFCHNSDLLEFGLPSDYTEEDIFEFLKKRRHTLDGVAITGGEPTLQPDLPEFIKKVRGLGLKVKLDTNGINPKMVNELVSEGLLDYVAMDIKASPENYAKVCGFDLNGCADESIWPHIFGKLTETKNFLMKGHVPYEFRTTVVDGLHTEEDFHGIAAFIEGADKYFLQCYKDSGNILDQEAGFSEPKVPTLIKYRDIVAPHVKFADIRGVDIEL